MRSPLAILQIGDELTDSIELSEVGNDRNVVEHVNKAVSNRSAGVATEPRASKRDREEVDTPFVPWWQRDLSTGGFLDKSVRSIETSASS